MSEEPSTAATPAGDAAGQRGWLGTTLRRYGLLSLQTGGMTLSGFVVSALAAYYFGATALKDAWDIAYVIPWVLLGVAGFENFQGVTTATFARLAETDREAGDTVLTTITVGLTGVALVVALVAFFFRGTLVHVVAPGLSASAAAIASHELAILAPTIPLIGIAMFFGSVQVAHGHAGATETVWLMTRLIVIALLVALPASLGVSRLSLGFVVGGVAALGTQLVLLRRTGLRFAPRVDFRSFHVREAFAQGGLFVLFAITTQACIVAGRDLCSRGPEGTIAALGYAISLVGPVYQFIAKPLMLIEGPKLVRATQSDPRAALRRYDRVLLVGLAVIVPVVVGIVVLREPIIRLLFQRGQLDAVATARIAAFLGVLAWSAIGDGVTSMSALPAMVQEKARWVPIAWTLAGVIQLAFMYATFPRLGVMSVAWGAVVGAALRGAFAVWFSRRSLARRGDGDR